jgi:TAK1-binding protein 1
VDRLKHVNAAVCASTTAVVALLYGNGLFVANVGDSRAVLCKEESGGRYSALQLSVDHDMNNEAELQRLQRLGVDVEANRNGRLLGTNQSTTRCIGNYYVKGGFKESELLASASEEPVIAEPEIEHLLLDEKCQFLILMSAGFYQALEEATGTRDANQDIVDMIVAEFRVQRTLPGVAQAVVNKVCRLHQDNFFRGSNSCLKVEDMTLLIRNFRHPLPNGITGNSIAPSFGELTISVGPELELPGKESDGTLVSADPWTPSNETRTGSTSSSEFTDKRFQDADNVLSLEKDEEGRIAAYVDFTEFYEAIEEAKSKGLVAPDFCL